MRTIRTALAVVLEKHAGTAPPIILSNLRGMYGELARAVSKAALMQFRKMLHNLVVVANDAGYSDFVADMVSVDDAFLEELTDDLQD